ncbi:hypothetical protein [Agromyces albus]|uniref:hypothetical protein n=1 Tax=Agromyces albus TaxID=205332 RepID=UPI0027D86BD1|nr:hypothetical protein [Agromyces albus]
MRQQFLLLRLRRAIRNTDAFDVVANMFLAVAPLDSEPGDGSDGERLLALPELTALLFAEQRSVPSGAGSSAKVLRAVHTLVPKVLHASSLRTTFYQLTIRHQPREGPTVVPRLTAAAITKEIYLRLPRFHHKERELLNELFTPTVRESIVARLGFGPEAMFSVFDAFHSYIPQSLVESIRSAGDELAEALEASPELERYMDTQSGGLQAATRRVTTRLAFDHLAEAVALSFDDLVLATALDQAELAALLSRMSIDLDAPNEGVVTAFLNGDNPMRTRPFLSRTGTSRQREWMLVQPTSLIFGMRELVEAALTAEPMDQTYMKHRGELLERRGMRALIDAIRPDVALANVEYNGLHGQRFEADGLLVIGHAAVVLEAKSNRLTQYARAGAPLRLWQELGPIISKAAQQAERLRALIEAGASIHIRSSSNLLDGSGDGARTNWDLDVSEVTEVFTIALSLEDLNYLVTITSELVESGLIPEGALSPWIVNVHDLEIAAQLLDRPAEFIQFLSRRRRTATMNNILAVDELDYVMHYLASGLFPEGSTSTTTLVLSLTDELDAWIFYENGLRDTPAPKPAQQIESGVNEVLTVLERYRPFGWLEASIGLLELAPDFRARVAHEAGRLRELSAGDGRPHSMYLETPPAPTKSLIFIAMSFPRGTQRNAVENQLVGYATLRRYASRADTVFCFGAWVGSQEVFDVFLTLSSPWSYDQALEAAVVTAGLAPGIQT